MTNKTLIVRGAREHNLKNVTVEMPRDQLVVITGLSGSGKSSLAFDTIYAEGQRRYVESLSAYARQFLEMMQKPDVDSIDGLSPAISIEQKTTSKNPRSTVGTVTEIYDYMRLLWARVGVPYSPATGLPIESQTPTQMVDRIKEMGQGTKLYIMAPIVRGRKGEYKKELADLRARGFSRAKIDGTIIELDDIPDLNKKIKHDISVVVDRLVLRDDLGNRLADSVETALKLANGLLIVQNAETNDETIFSQQFACPVSGFTIPEIEPRLFSFNAPQGACPSCDGLGIKMTFDEDLIVPDKTKSIVMGAIEPWSKTFAAYYMQALEAVARHYGVRVTTPWKDIPRAIQEKFLYGTGDEDISIAYEDSSRTYKTKKPFEGVVGNLHRRLLETESPGVREEISQYQISAPCTECYGHRLKPEALSVKVGTKHIGEISQLSIADAHAWFSSLPKKLSKSQNEIAARILKEISDRLNFLLNVGLDYLTMARASGTLSGGESQRIRLASQIGSGLTGVLYVLDEPSIGLHQRDNDRLLETLKRLRDLGNTVLVVEHDEDAIRAADYLIDMGPGAGVHGGHVVAAGTPTEVIKSKDSITAQYLNGQKFIAIPQERRTGKKQGKKTEYLKLSGATGNNLKNVSAEIPLGTFTCVTGVSGSGKSTFTLDTLYQAASRRLMNTRDLPAPFKSIEGLEYLDKVIDIDQSPIGRTPRSNPATYTGRLPLFGNGLRDFRNQRHADMTWDDSRSTCAVDDVNDAKVMGSLKSKCISCPMFM
jgi:excinuclease ABC subunit A